MQNYEYVDVDILDLGGLRSTSEDLDDELLGESLAKEQQSPIIVGPLVNGLRPVYDGNRRTRAARKKGLTKLFARILDRAPTPEELAKFQLISDIHKKHLTPYERSMGILAVEDANPELNSKQLTELIDMEESLFSRYRQCRKLCPQALEAYKSGQIGLMRMAEIARESEADQVRMLTVKAGRTAMNREKKKQEEAEKPPDRTARIRIPLAVDSDDISVHGAVTIAGIPGKEISWTDAEDILREALKAVKDAQKRNLGLRAAQASWRDMAAPKIKAEA